MSLGSTGSIGISVQRLTCPRQRPFGPSHPGWYPASYPQAATRKRQPSARGFLPPFDHRHSLLGHPVPIKDFRSPYGRPTRRCAWTLTGFPRSAHPRCGRIGRPLYPGTKRCSHDRARISGRRSPPLPTARPYHPGPHPIFPRLSVTRHHQGFTHVRPPGLPLTRSLPWMDQGPLGFFSGLHTPTGRTCSACQSGDRHRTLAWNYTSGMTGPPICEFTRNVRLRVAIHARWLPYLHGRA